MSLFGRDPVGVGSSPGEESGVRVRSLMGEGERRWVWFRFLLGLRSLLLVGLILLL